jgi:rRNA maturation endonuclease Nob1
MVEKLHCNACNYNFLPRAKKPIVCPYCGRQGTLRRAKHMQDWIDETLGELEG